MKKIAILLGRGLEGCGVSQCARQMQIVTGADIFYSIDKKWPRSGGMDFPTNPFSVATEWEGVAAKINEYDLCVIYSVPSTKHPEACQNNFVDMVKAIKVRKAFINVDHKQASISRNANLAAICENVDVIMTYSLDNAFSKTIAKFGIKKPFFTMNNGFDFDGHREKYWRPIEEQQANVMRWIGRSARWKGPDIMIDFHEAELMQNGFITILEGLEASIGYTDILYRDIKEKEFTDRRKVMNYFRPEKQHGELVGFSTDLHGKEVVGVGAYLYNPYNNTEAMHRMGYSAFGSDMYYLAPEFYGNNIENCHAEVVACGAIPVFHKHFNEHIIHKVQGLPISECKNTGTISLDRTNFKEASEIMTKLKNDNGMRDDWREMAFEFWKQHADGKAQIDDIIEKAFRNDTQLIAEPSLDDFF